MTLRVGILGAGIIGLTSAIRVLELAAEQGTDVRVTVVAEHVAAGRTSDAAGADWEPNYLGETDEKTVVRWCETSLARFKREPRHAGVRWIRAHRYAPVNGCDRVEPPWVHLHPGGYEYVSDTHIAFTTMGISMDRYMPHLMERYLALGGVVEQRRVASLGEMTDDFDVVIHCSGIGAGQLAGDLACEPARGACLLVEAPWIDGAHVDAESFPTVSYIVPRDTALVVGGTFELGETSAEYDDAVAERLWADACRMHPPLARGRILRKHTGLRPFRHGGIRLERDARDPRIVHHYGHGGSGVTLSWGTSEDAARLALGLPVLDATCCKPLPRARL